MKLVPLPFRKAGGHVKRVPPQFRKAGSRVKRFPLPFRKSGNRNQIASFFSPNHQPPVMMVTDALENEQLTEMPCQAGFPMQPSRKSSIGYFHPKSLEEAGLQESPSEIPRQSAPILLTLRGNELQSSTSNMKSNRLVQIGIATAAIMGALFFGISRYRAADNRVHDVADTRSTETPELIGKQEASITPLETKGKIRPSVSDNLPKGWSIIGDGKGSGAIVIVSETSRIEAATARPTVNGVEFGGPIRVKSLNTGSLVELPEVSSRLWLEKNGGKFTTSGEMSVSMPPPE